MTQPREATEDTIDFSRYRVLVAGDFSSDLHRWAGLTELGVKVTLVGVAPEPQRHEIQQLALEELVFVEDAATLPAEVYARWSANDLVVLVGASSDAIEETLRPWMEEDAAASLNPLLPLVRVDDQALDFLDSGEQWAFFLLARTLGLEPKRAREFMEECCGYQNENS